jgi:group I intron endonuclease
MKSYINMNSTVTTLGANYLVHTGYLNTISRLKVCTVASYRYYSTSKSDSQSSDLPPVPILTINNLDNKDCIKSSRILLKDKGGIYSFINTVNGNQYIGSAKDFYLRLNEHLENKKSNLALQKAFAKYGLDQFKFCIYEYFTYESKIISHKALTDLETSYINRFNFDNLYNFKAIATSSLGYKHTEEARLKMVDYYKDKNNHPMFGKTHTEEALSLISKPGELNPMFGKKHSEASKASMSEKKNKYPLGVGIYDLDDNLILKFNNNVELAKHLDISKVTVGKYLNSGLLYNKTYRFKPIQD